MSQWAVSLPNMYSSPSLVTKAEVPLLQAAPIITTDSSLASFLGFTAFSWRLPLSEYNQPIQLDNFATIPILLMEYFSA